MAEQNVLKAKITGMHCDSCVIHVKKAINNIDGISEVTIDNWKDGNVQIIKDASLENAVIRKAVNTAGYDANIIEETASRNISSKTEKSDYDLVIIGGGSAAFSAAIKASELDKRVLIVNDGLPVGGTCVNVGCVPSKALIRAAEAFHRTKQTNFDGVESGGSRLNFKKVITQKRQLVEELRQKKYMDIIIDDKNITVLEGRAKFENTHTIQVNEEVKSAEKILIATGSSTFIPDIPGLKDVNYHTNETIYELEELPEHLIILGGRYIALENAQMFARLGAQVTVLQRSSHILPTESTDISEQLQEYLRAEGLTIKTGVKINSITQKKQKVILNISIDKNEETIEGTHLFVATGRKGNSDGLELEKIGIETDGNGFVKTDEYLRTAVPNIFTAGDVIGDNMFVYTAAYEGALSVENAFSDNLKAKNYNPLPWVIFTDPQVAGIGLDEDSAENANIDYDVSILSLSDIPRALAARNTNGFIKLIRNKSNDTLIGARILASEGSELLMEIALAIKYGIKVSELRQMFHPYLTLSEGIKLAAIGFDKDVGKLSCCAT